MRTTTMLFSGLLLILLNERPATADAPLPVKAGDVWVMAGDSITAQRLHSNYIEAFYRTRFPTLGLRFRNSGIGGNTTGSVLARFDYDIADFKPTIISIELGMNDVGRGDDPKGYIEGMQKLIDRVQAVGATPVLISSSPVNDGSLMDDWKADRCRRIHPYTEALVKLGEEKKVIVADQYHTLLEMWGKNKRNEKDAVNLGGDAVHPGAVGQLTMAAVILDKLGADREVSSATLKADGTVVESKLCKISDVAAAQGGLSFTRLDERGPWPIHASSRAALQLMPAIADLSRYTLKVTDLKPGDYTVRMNGKDISTLSAQQLADGWNMSTVAEGVLAERGTAILGLIAKLQGALNQDWRKASKEKDSAKLAEAQAAIESCEAELAEACRPVAIQFEIKPAAK